MKKKLSNSLYRKLILEIAVFLIIPFLSVIAFFIVRLATEGDRDYKAGIDLIVEKGRSNRELHVQNVYSIANRICSNSSLIGFLAVKYSSKNLTYYMSQIKSILSSDSEDNYGYKLRLYYANETIPRGLGTFYRLENLGQDGAEEFINSDLSELWVAPCDSSKYPNSYTPFLKHYTYMRKVFLNDHLLYILTISVPESVMNSFLQNKPISDYGMPALAETIEFGSALIINSDSKVSFSETIDKSIEAKIQEAKKNGSIVCEANVNGFPQSLIYIYPHNKQEVMLVVVESLIVLFAVSLVLVVMRFIKNIFKGIYQCLAEFENSISSGFTKKLPIKGDDEISQISSAFNEQIDKIQNLLEITVVQEGLVKDSQLKALQQQINPHFLYNTLEVFSYKMELYKHYDEADAMVAFSNMLRYNTKGEQRFSSLRLELAQVDNYMCIQRLKFTDISLDVNIPADQYELKLPRFILQPLIENCFTSGYYGNPLQIVLNGFEEDGYICFELIDNGKGISNDEMNCINKELTDKKSYNRLGIGLSNINARLCLYYSDVCSLHITSEEKKQTTVTWKVPKEMYKPVEQSLGGIS